MTHMLVTRSWPATLTQYDLISFSVSIMASYRTLPLLSIVPPHLLFNTEEISILDLSCSFVRLCYPLHLLPFLSGGQTNVGSHSPPRSYLRSTIRCLLPPAIPLLSPFVAISLLHISYFPPEQYVISWKISLNLSVFMHSVTAPTCNPSPPLPPPLYSPCLTTLIICDYIVRTIYFATHPMSLSSSCYMRSILHSR